MPNALIKKFAQKAGKTVEEVEKMWERAKKIAAEKFPSMNGPHYWADVNAITQRGLKLRSGKLSEFIDDLDIAQLDLEAPAYVPATDVPPAEPAAVDSPEVAQVHDQTVTVPHNDGGKLVSMLFGARDWAHTLHLKTQSHAMHLALGDLYDELVGLADGIAETTQGKHGLLSILADSSEFVGTDECGFVCKLAAWLESQGRACISSDDTYLLNQLDEVIAAVYRAKYKIENLK